MWGLLPTRGRYPDTSPQLPLGFNFYVLNYINHMYVSLATTTKWLNRNNVARACIDPETGERIRTMTESERYNNVRGSAWAVRH